MEEKNVKGIIDGIISAVPIVNSIYTGVQSAQAISDQQELEEWKKSVVDNIIAIKADIAKIQDENFKVILYESTPLGLETDTEKKAYLLSGINYAASNSLSKDKWRVFLSCFKKYTNSHFMYLHHLYKYKKENPGRNVEIDHYKNSLDSFWNNNNLDTSLISVIENNLIDDKLIIDSLWEEYDESGHFTEMNLSDFGDEFITVFGL